VSIALFATVAAIWVALVLPSIGRGRAERARAAPPAVALQGEPGGRVRRLPASQRRRPVRRRVASRAVIRRRRVLAALAVAELAGLRVWAAIGGRWWVAAAAAGVALAAYLLALVVLARSRARGRSPRSARRASLPAGAVAGWATSVE
jgi:hypothetical protein